MSDTWAHRYSTMRTGKPKEEDVIHSALQNAKLTKGMKRDIVLLITDDRVEWANKYECTWKMINECDLFTIPDFTWIPNQLPGYLDGQVHDRNGPRTKDERINMRLTAGGWPPLRFSYASQISQIRVLEIVNEIRETLGFVE